LTAVCVIGAVLAALLKHERPEMGLLLALSVCVAVLAAAGDSLGAVRDLADQMIATSGVDAELFAPLLKILGLSLVCRLGTELCRDAGEGAIAALVEIGGAAGAILLATPLFRAVWTLLRSLI